MITQCNDKSGGEIHMSEQLMNLAYNAGKESSNLLKNAFTD